MSKRMFFFIYTLQVRRLIGLFTIHGGTPVHEADNERVPSFVTDVETNSVSFFSIPPTVIPCTNHVNLECLPFVCLFQVKECLLSTSGTSAFLTPEEFTCKISTCLILEYKYCSRRGLLKWSKTDKWVSACRLECIFRRIVWISCLKCQAILTVKRFHVLNLWIVGRSSSGSGWSSSSDSLA